MAAVEGSPGSNEPSAGTCPICRARLCPLDSRSLREAKLWRCTSCDFVRKEAIDGARITPLIEDVNERESRWPIEWLLERVEIAPSVARIACLDVGCWDGDLLAGLPPSWGKQGLEPNVEAAARARSRGLDVVVGRIEDTPLPSGKFDLVTLIDVVEHVKDPRSAIARASAAVAPSGKLVLLTGDASSVGARFWGSRWYYYHYPEHVSFLTPGCARTIFARLGFGTVRLLRVSHPLSGARRDVVQILLRLRRASSSQRTSSTSLGSCVGPNRITLSRVLRRRDHLLVIATKAPDG